jgi:uncharacterized protein YbjT (DUF2867 family)
MKILVTGATGMVGSEVIRQALVDKDISEVYALVRTPLNISNPKLKVILHTNFQEYHNLNNVFSDIQACIWCLGISQFKVPADEYQVITYDYAVAGAQAILQANADVSFVFLSGMGADNAGDSKALFARVKGRTENALDTFPFKKLYFARPGGIKSIQKIEDRPFYERIVDWFFPVLKVIAPKYFIDSEQLAKALIVIAKKGYQNRIVSNEALSKM